jgi:hypothetical protein
MPSNGRRGNTGIPAINHTAHKNIILYLITTLKTITLWQERQPLTAFGIDIEENGVNCFIRSA